MPLIFLFISLRIAKDQADLICNELVKVLTVSSMSLGEINNKLIEK